MFLKIRHTELHASIWLKLNQPQEIFSTFLTLCEYLCMSKAKTCRCSDFTVAWETKPVVSLSHWYKHWTVPSVFILMVSMYCPDHREEWNQMDLLHLTSATQNYSLYLVQIRCFSSYNTERQHTSISTSSFVPAFHTPPLDWADSNLVELTPLHWLPLSCLHKDILGN